MKGNSIKLLMLLGLIISSTTSYSQVAKEFEVRYNEIIKGKITTIGNNTISAETIAPTNDPSVDNYDTEMKNVDVDNDGTTFNSSNATFDDPRLQCLSIKKAFLYWSATDIEKEWKEGDPVNNEENQPDWNYNEVLVMLPTLPGEEGEYIKITADKSKGEVIFRGRDELNHFSNDPYTCVKDITKEVNDIVSKNGNPFGKYQVANVESSTGLQVQDHSIARTGVAGGWQIVFIYEYLDAPSRQITLFDGYAQIIRGNNDGVSFDIDGFQTVPRGDVNASILFGALEGDSVNQGDQLTILRNGTANDFVAVSDGTNRPSNNFFNSSITNENGVFITREPASTNTLGYDAGIVELNNPGNEIIGNNQTSTKLKLTTDADSYGLYLLGFSIEVFIPDLSPILTSVDKDVNKPLLPGEQVTYGIEFKNSGNDNARNVKLTTIIPQSVDLITPDNLPTGITYTYDTTKRELVFLVDNSLVQTNGDLIKVPYSVKVKDNCYFLVENCSDLNFESQFTATYIGALNDSPQETKSSSNVDNCKVGNQSSIKFSITPEKPFWETKDLNVTLSCDDKEGLEDAQKMTPKANCDFKLVKTSGTFIPDNDSCASTGKYVNEWVFEDACKFGIQPFVQTITIFDDKLPVLDDCSDKLQDLVLECGPKAEMQKQADDWNAKNLAIILGCVSDNCSVIAAENITSDYNFKVSDKPICEINGSTIPVTYSINDNCGNILTKPLNIIYKDETGPEINLCDTQIKDEIVSCSKDGLDKVIKDWDDKNKAILKGCVKDLCNPELDVEIISEKVGEIEEGCYNTGKVTLKYYALDYCKNKSTDSIEVTLEVIDDTPPVLVVNLDKQLNVVCDKIPAVPNLKFEDDCSLTDVTVVYDEKTTYEDKEGQDFVITRTWTVTDVCNNSDVFTQIVNVSSATFQTNVNDNRCIDDGIIDLNSYLVNDPEDKNGWEFVSGPVKITLKDGTFDPYKIDLDSLGIFKFTHTVAEGFCYRNTIAEIDVNDNCIVYPCGPENFTISKTITPNGDAYNEFFMVTGSRECEFPIDLKIFNRWGAIIYENPNYKGDWNGFTNDSSFGSNNTVTNGTYYYVINLVGSGFDQFSGPIYVGTR